MIEVPGGAWLTITPQAPDPGPRADFDIVGPFSGQVAVTLPSMDRDDLPPDWNQPVVFHNPDNWDLVWSGPAVYENPVTNTVTIATDTLSPYTTVDMAADVLPEFDSSDLPRSGIEVLNYIAEAPTSFPGPASVDLDGCGNTNRLVTTASIPSGQVECSREYVDGVGRWTITNVTDDKFTSLIGSGAVATLYFSGPLTYVDRSPTSNRLLESGLADIYRGAISSGGDGFPLGPGASITFEIAEGSSGTIVFDDAFNTSLANTCSATSSCFTTSGGSLEGLFCRHHERWPDIRGRALAQRDRLSPEGLEQSGSLASAGSTLAKVGKATRPRQSAPRV